MQLKAQESRPYLVSGETGTETDPANYGDLFAADLELTPLSSYYAYDFEALKAINSIAGLNAYKHSQMMIDCYLVQSGHIQGGPLQHNTNGRIKAMQPSERQAFYEDFCALMQEAREVEPSLTFDKNGPTYLLRKALYEEKRPEGYGGTANIRNRILKGLIPSQFLKALKAWSDPSPEGPLAKNPIREILWLKYLGLLEESHLIQKAKYPAPTDIGFRGEYIWTADTDLNTYRESAQKLFDSDTGTTLCDTLEQTSGQSKAWLKMSYGNTHAFDAMGNFGARVQKDDRGPYIEFYDIWDLHPFGTQMPEASSFVPGAQPFGLYHRIYLDDIYSFYEAATQETLAADYAYLPHVLREDKETLKHALKLNPMNLRYAPDSLRDDEHIVALAIVGNGRALQYASDRLKNDEKIVMMATEKTATALFDAHPRFRASKPHVTVALRKDPSQLYRVDKSLHLDADIKALIQPRTAGV